MAAAKPLTHEEIANTEKKLDMPLDDIIKMSKNATNNRAKKQQRAPNKSQKVFHNAAQEKAMKVRRYMDSRPFVRQGVLAQRRSNFQGNQFPIATEVARKAALASFHNRPFDRNVVAYPKKARAGTFWAQKRAVNGASAAKSPQLQPQPHQGDGAPKQRPKTLDSLFANLKERRMNAVTRPNHAVPRPNNIGSRQNNAVRPYNGNGGRPTLPWARGRFGH